ncbi:MAG TPA: hypothetical protein VEB64_09430 [Azospirillaceae bacterium]|nr:hypothetical protein [Azospirillaceae bacterium]
MLTDAAHTTPPAKSKGDGCRWIEGRPGTGDAWNYCGVPVRRAGEAWCCDHRARVYAKPVKGDQDDA